MSTKIKVGDRVAFYPPIGRRTGRVTAIVKNFTFIAGDMLHGKETSNCRVPHGTKIVRLKPKKAVEPPTPRTRWSFDLSDGESNTIFNGPRSEIQERYLKIHNFKFKKVMWREVL